ncbi:MAG: hypothetical protein V7739_20450 [Motiliproteus sp.]
MNKPIRQRICSLYSTGLIVIAMLLAGCAEQARVLHFKIPDNSNPDTVWPSPPAKPRFAYIGDLTGETNLENVNDQAKAGVSSFLEILAGVGLDKDLPVVLRRPQSGMVDSAGRIFVTDVGGGSIFVFDEVQGKLEVWDRFSIDKPFLQPIGIVEGEGGHVLVVDAEYGMVIELTAAGEFVRTFGGGTFQRPTGIARDPVSGRIFVADTHAHHIKVFSADGTLVDVWGSKGDKPGQFNSPVYLSLYHGSLYITDTLNARIQVMSLDGDVQNVFGQRGLWIGNLVRPKGVSLDSDGNIYIVESYYDHLLVYNQQGELLLPIGGAGKNAGRFFLPTGTWSDSRDRIYVADMMNGRVSIFQYLGSDQ